MLHAQGYEEIKMQSKPGGSIEHGIDSDDGAISLIKENDTYLVPTLIAPSSVLESDEMPEHIFKKMKDVVG